MDSLATAKGFDDLPAQTRLLQRDGVTLAQVGTTELHCRYQAVLSPMLMRVVGVEAQLQLRMHDAPAGFSAFYSQLAPEDGLRLLHLVLALQVANLPAGLEDDAWVFLPLLPPLLQRHAADAARARAELAALPLPPERIVLDLKDSGDLDLADLQRGIAGYRAAGFRVALAPAHFDRVLATQPDVVRLGPAQVHDAEHSAWARRLFPQVTAQLQEAGSLVLADGIASATQAHIATDANAELIQGDWIAPACAALPTMAALEPHCRALADAGTLTTPPRNDTHLRSCFMTVWNAYHSGRELDEIVGEIREAQVTRLYAIDSRGFQIGATALTAHALRGRRHPLTNATGACWARRHYFRNALAHPGRVQVTSPYLSLTEQRLCVTYSCLLMRPGQQIVLCMDTLL